MPHQLFLSHDSRDKGLAESLARAINRLSLNQISVWHSSDSSGQGGLKPGQVWLDEIRTQLSKSKAVVALLTPRSISGPWLLFESGFGAATADCVVIPVCVGIDSLASVPFPLAMYQSYQLADYESVKRFIEKLLPKYEIHFDEEMARPVMTELISKLVNESSTDFTEKASVLKPDIADAFAEMKTHIDKRMLEIMKLGTTIESAKLPTTESAKLLTTSYSIAIDIKAYSPKADEQYLEVESGMTVQDVLDSVFYLLPGVIAFKYLEEWLLRDSESDIKLVIREIGSKIPASFVFTPNSKWTVMRLKSPYKPQDSSDTERWYN